MKLSPTKATLKKLELLAKQLGYKVRYEKGNFTSGYCLVEHQRVAIVNKFYDTEGRINVLLDILSQFRPDADEKVELDEKSAKLWKKLKPFLGITIANGEEE